jgi:ADP-ribose pyrophosphatase
MLAPHENPDRTLSETVTNARYAHKGRLLRLRVATVRLPNGRITTREIVEHPGAVAIIPIRDDQKILLTKQYRTAAGRHLLEIPAGTLERGETPASCARRELAEETGHAPGRMRRLFTCYLAPGYSTERIHFFLANHLMPKKARQAEDEMITVQAMTLNEAVKAIEHGRIQDAKTVCAVYYLATQRRSTRRHSLRERP